MEKELIIPEKVTVEIDNKIIKVSGPKGQLKKEFKYFFDIKITKKENKVVVSAPSDKRKIKAIAKNFETEIYKEIPYSKELVEAYSKGKLLNFSL